MINKYSEICGFPASGKSTYYSKIKIKNIYSLEDFFFYKIFDDKNKLRFFLLYFLFLFCKKSFFYNFFFNRFYLKKKNNNFYFIKILRKKFYKFNKKNKKILIVYKKLVFLSSYSYSRKIRNINRFKYYISLFQFFIDEKPDYKIQIVEDEGFYQKLFHLYKDDSTKIFKYVNQYLKLIPKFDELVIINTNLKICISRSKKRLKNFNYADNKYIEKVFKKILNLILSKTNQNKKII